MCAYLAHVSRGMLKVYFLFDLSKLAEILLIQSYLSRVVVQHGGAFVCNLLFLVHTIQVLLSSLQISFF